MNRVWVVLALCAVVGLTGCRALTGAGGIGLGRGELVKSKGAVNTVKMADGAITADGALDEAAWKSAVAMSGFVRGPDPAEVKAQYGTASILKESRVVFNICGNKYRLVVKINYPYQVIYIRFLGTHEQYDAKDAKTI